MKKIACLLLAVLLVGIMSVPAMAIPIYDKSFEQTFNEALTKVLTAKGSKYSAYSYYFSYVGNTANPKGTIMFWFFDTVSPKVGDSHVTAMYNPVNGAVSNAFLSVKSFNGVEYINGKYYFNNGSNNFGDNPAVFAVSTANPACVGNNYDDILWYFRNPPSEKTALQSLVNTASAITDVGYTPQSWQALQAQIGAAQAVLDNADATQEEVNAATAALQSTVDGLEIYIAPSTEDLQTLVAEADTKQEPDYTPVSWQPFSVARTSAHTLLVQPYYTPVEVEETTVELRTTMNALVFVTPEPPPQSSDPPKPPPGSGGYDVPQDMINAVSTGSVIPLLSGFIQPFLSHATSAMPIVIGLFAILLGIKVVPRIFKSIFRGWK